MLYLAPLYAYASQYSGLITGESAALVIGQTGFSLSSSGHTSNALDYQYGIAFDSQGNLWVADPNNNRVLEFTPPFYTGEAASEAIGQINLNSNTGGDTANTLQGPTSVAFDSHGNMWVADGSNNRVLEYPPANQVTNGFASNVLGQVSFTAGSSGNTANTFNYPYGLSFDPSGNLWVVDFENYRLLKFVPANQVTNGFAAAAIGQVSLTAHALSPSATANTMEDPYNIAFDSVGNMWVTDEGFSRVLEYPVANEVTNGFPSNVIGQTSFTTSGCGACSPTANSLNGPEGIAIYNGNLWVGDSGWSRVLEFIAANMVTNGYASNVIGEPSLTTSNGGTSANMIQDAPWIAFDSSGDLWVSDNGNSRILEFAPLAAPTVSISPSATSIDLGQTETYIATVYNGVGPFTVNLVSNGNMIAGSTINLPGGSAGLAFAPSYAGSNTFNVIAADTGVSPSYVFNSPSNTIFVANAPTVSIGASSTSIYSGSSVTFTANVPSLVGIGPFTVNLLVGGTVVANANIPAGGGSNTMSYTFSSTGTYSANLIATDLGTTVQFAFNSLSNSITVSSQPSSGGGNSGGSGGVICPPDCGSTTVRTTTSTTSASTTSVATTSVTTVASTMPQSTISPSTVQTTTSVSQTTTPTTSASQTQSSGIESGTAGTFAQIGAYVASNWLAAAIVVILVLLLLWWLLAGKRRKREEEQPKRKHRNA